MILFPDWFSEEIWSILNYFYDVISKENISDAIHFGAAILMLSLAIYNIPEKSPIARNLNPKNKHVYLFVLSWIAYIVANLKVIEGFLPSVSNLISNLGLFLLAYNIIFTDEVNQVQPE